MSLRCGTRKAHHNRGRLTLAIDATINAVYYDLYMLNLLDEPLLNGDSQKASLCNIAILVQPSTPIFSATFLSNLPLPYIPLVLGIDFILYRKFIQRDIQGTAQ